jgi:branched-chain amino acid transport system substrate-binding protein
MGATEVVNEKYRSDVTRYGYWMAKGWPVPARLTSGYVDALEDAIRRGAWKPETKTAAIWGEDTDLGRSFGRGIREQLQSASWNIVAEEYFPLTETDYYPLLRKFQDAKVVLLAGTSTSPSSISAFVKQAKEVGIRGLIIADGLGWAGEWYSLTGDASDGVLDQIPGWTSPGAREFAERFEKRCGFKPSPSAAGLAFDYTNFAIKIAKEALSKYGVIDRSTLYKVGRDELITGRLTYRDGIVMKEYRYTPESDPDPVVGDGQFMFPVLQYKSGRSRVIWPLAQKEAELVTP